MKKIVKKQQSKKPDFGSIGQTLLDACNEEWEFIKTGSTLLDNSLGGGWLIGGIAGIFGGESSGKTLLALEAAAKCQKMGGYVYYADAAAVLDKSRAMSVFNLDPIRTLYAVPETVEDFFEQCIKFCWKCEEYGVKGLYILDDLDTLDTKVTQITDSTIARLQKIGKGLMEEADIMNMRSKLDKAAVMSALLKSINKRLMRSNVAAYIISQTRKKIGATWGSPVTTSGGEALRFYCTQRVELHVLGKIIEGERVVGVPVRAKVVKNKCSSPFQVAEYPIYFATGIRNVESLVDFLADNSDAFELTEAQKEGLKKKKKDPAAAEQEQGEDGKKKKKKEAYAYEDVVYTSKEAIVSAIENDPDKYREIIRLANLVWDEKFRVV